MVFLHTCAERADKKAHHTRREWTSRQKIIKLLSLNASSIKYGECVYCRLSPYLFVCSGRASLSASTCICRKCRFVVTIIAGFRGLLIFNYCPLQPLIPGMCVARSFSNQKSIPLKLCHFKPTRSVLSHSNMFGTCSHEVEL